MRMTELPTAAGRLVRLAVLSAGLAACTPAMNWREVRPADSQAVALFPCKPDNHARRVMLAGAEVSMQLASCTASGHVYALSHADVGQADRVTPALQALARAAADNIGGQATRIGAQSVPGMAAHPLAQRWAVTGQRADGSPIEAQVAVFTRGSRVYQASVVGPMIDRDASTVFFEALKLP